MRTSPFYDSFLRTRSTSRLVQKMMLHIWSDYVEKAGNKVKAADAADTTLMGNIDNAAQHEADTQYDYDPFAETATDQHEDDPLPST